MIKKPGKVDQIELSLLVFAIEAWDVLDVSRARFLYQPIHVSGI